MQTGGDISAQRFRSVPVDPDKGVTKIHLHVETTSYFESRAHSKTYDTACALIVFNNVSI